MANAFAVIMAGGSSEHLSVLTETRAEPAVPFGGKFRLIDFPLSNCVNSGIYNVAVLTQYKPRSLNDHIGIGRPWDLDRATGGLRLLQPYRGGPYGDWQQGTADAVRRNLDFVLQQNEEHVLILAGDHIYLMNYQPMLRQHIQSGADLTVAVRRVNSHETHRYGIVTVGADDRIIEFREKPRHSQETLASMGIYVFRKSALVDLLSEGKYVDFGRDVLPAMVKQQGAVRAYQFPGYWADVGNVHAYWEANMSLLAEDPALNLYDQDWIIHTRRTGAQQDRRQRAGGRQPHLQRLPHRGYGGAQRPLARRLRGRRGNRARQCHPLRRHCRSRRRGGSLHRRQAGGDRRGRTGRRGGRQPTQQRAAACAQHRSDLDRRKICRACRVYPGPQCRCSPGE